MCYFNFQNIKITPCFKFHNYLGLLLASCFTQCSFHSKQKSITQSSEMLLTHFDFTTTDFFFRVFKSTKMNVYFGSFMVLMLFFLAIPYSILAHRPLTWCLYFFFVWLRLFFSWMKIKWKTHSVKDHFYVPTI